MRFRWLTVLLFLLLPIQAQTHEKRFPAKLVSIKAMLYYANTGKFSDDLFTWPDLELWNTIIGEGPVAGPATSLFFVVETSGDFGANVYGNDVLTVTTQVKGGAAVRKQFKHLDFSDTGRHFEGFWLHDVGCLPVSITVQVNGDKPVTKTVPFECGE